MKPLIVLLLTFGIAVAVIRVTGGRFDYVLAGRIAMAVMLLFTSAAHFAFSKGMTMMIPGSLPLKRELVYFTGIIEIISAVALLIPRLSFFTGWFLIAFFILLLPANVYAAIRHIDYQKGTFNGKGPAYLWFRVPLQVFFIVWTYIFNVFYN